MSNVVNVTFVKQATKKDKSPVFTGGGDPVYEVCADGVYYTMFGKQGQQPPQNGQWEANIVPPKDPKYKSTIYLNKFVGGGDSPAAPASSAPTPGNIDLQLLQVAAVLSTPLIQFGADDDAIIDNCMRIYNKLKQKI